MSLRISEIHIAECGPLPKQAWTELDTKDLVLIYGKNESGKSFLIDLLINSLFRNKKEWGYLRGGVSGKVVLTGSLAGSDGGDSERMEFSPKNKPANKLEDYLIKLPGAGLPAELTRLLVVRAGETEIIRNEHGLTVDFLKALFSQKRIISEIDGRLPASIENAEINEAEGRMNFTAKKGNEIQNYYALSEKLKKLNELWQEVNEKYESGELKTLQDKKKVLEEKKSRLELARRHLAFSVAREIEKIKEELEKFPTPEDIADLRRKIEEFKDKNREAARQAAQVKKLEEELAAREEVEKELKLQEKARRFKAHVLSKEKKEKQEELRRLEESTGRLEELYKKYREKVLAKKQKEKELENKRPVVEEYRWLEVVKEKYSNLIEAGKKPLAAFKPVLIITFLSGLVGLILSLVHKAGLALPFFLVSLLGLIFIMWQSLRPQRSEAESREIQVIKDKFQEKFGRELSSKADLEAQVKIREKDFYEFGTVTEQLQQLKNDCRQILTELNLLVGGGLPAVEADERIDKVEKVLAENRVRVERLKQEIEGISARLSKLDVEEKDFEYEDPGVEFSRERYERLKIQMDRLTQREIEKTDCASRLEKYNLELDDLSQEISRWFEQKFKENIEPEAWEEKLREAESWIKKLREELSSKTGELSGLGVSAEDYLAEDPGETYHPEKLRQLESELKDVSQSIAEVDRRLHDLKINIATNTDSDPTLTWDNLLEALFRKIEQTREQLKKIEAALLSKILLSSVIKDLDREEAEKVEEILQVPEVGQMLFRLTNRYRAIFSRAGNEEEKEILYVSDGTDEFPLADLSTGAREQVLLALRLAFIKKILRNRKSFIILDDAFQHTDYERRPLIVDNLVELAGQGWQIFYLTMDDHLRDLFHARASSLGDRYRFIELSD
ncbi:MAG: ATP-binding protein [Candidatus Saccharicenans sp.]